MNKSLTALFVELNKDAPEYFNTHTAKGREFINKYSELAQAIDDKLTAANDTMEFLLRHGSLNESEPIQLTKEELEKFEFQLIKDGTFHINSYFNLDESGHLYYRSDYTGINIKHVHQLQNLYFTLTGEELTYRQ